LNATGFSTDLWPELPWREWGPTVSTMHLWLQIVGKVRLALAPPLNHWWHTTLYVSSRGLTTSAIPYGPREFQVDLDFVDHRLLISDSAGGAFAMPLVTQAVARFYREFMAGLSGLGIDVHISTKPVQIDDAISFDADERNATYEASHAQALWRGLVQADRVLKVFQTGFMGEASPVHLFWGSFDLATSRYSGRPAPSHTAEGLANPPSGVTEEGYFRADSAMGWWPRTDSPGPSFYAYTRPEPPGYRSAGIRPADAFFNGELGEFILPYDAVRGLPDPDGAVLEFLESTYAAGADLAG
jgi:hypothetical protein